jgi:hypothetical protein
MFTLAIVHVETRFGPCRLNVSEQFNGSLVVERIGFGYTAKIAEMERSGEGRDEDSRTLLQVAINELESFAGKVVDVRQIPHLAEETPEPKERTGPQLPLHVMH